MAGIIAALALLVAGFVHHDRLGPLPRCATLYRAELASPPAPVDEGPCVACVLAALTAPAALPAFDVPPLVHAMPGLRAEEAPSAPDTPALFGRSPPRIPA